MKRSEFLKTLGLVGAGAVLPIRGANAAPDKGRSGLKKTPVPEGVDCVLIPQETEGPYPLDLSGNSAMFRQDVTEGRAGIPLNVRMTIVNINDDCAPIPNARVDIWHCDKDGVYSGYSQPGQTRWGRRSCGESR